MDVEHGFFGPLRSVGGSLLGLLMTRGSPSQLKEFNAGRFWSLRCGWSGRPFCRVCAVFVGPWVVRAPQLLSHTEAVESFET